MGEPNSSDQYKQLFTSIYERQLWNGGNANVPLSGPGSSLGCTQTFRSVLESYIQQYEIKSILDLGCGDLTWISTTSVFTSNTCKYWGYDVVESILAPARVKYASDSRKVFVTADITNENDAFPVIDLIIVRDVLFHLESQAILRLFRKLRATSFKYIFLTSHPNVEVNTDVFDRWYYRSINLLREPYSLPLPNGSITEHEFNRSILFYTKEQFSGMTRNVTETQAISQGIPQIIHQIWIGPKPIPSDYLRYMETWKKHHPSWKYKLWTDKEVADHPMQHREWYDRVSTYAQKADILRYDILMKEGGLYVDCDFEALMSLDEICKNKSFVIGYERNGVLCNALIASVPQHPILLEAQKRLPASLAVPQCVPSASGPGFITSIVHEMAHLSGVYCADIKVFYPYCWDSVKPETYPKETLAVHHWAKSWW